MSSGLAFEFERWRGGHYSAALLGTAWFRNIGIQGQFDLSQVDMAALQ